MSELSKLRPTEKHRVIDLAKAAGVDVSDWANFKGGARRAQVNPKYCYEWSFVQPGKVAVLNMWFAHMRSHNNRIIVDVRMRKHARKNAQRGGKGVWTKRAERFDEALQIALRDKLPIRVIVCDGDIRRSDDSNARSSRVHQRELDPVAWAVTAYDQETGKCRLTRGVVPGRAVKGSVPLSGTRTVIAEIASAIGKALLADPGSVGVLPASTRERRPQNGGTLGYGLILGKLNRALAIELWLDHYSGSSTPRAWVGFSSTAPRALGSLLSLSVLAGMKKTMLRRTPADVTATPFFHFKEPLQPHEFDVLVREHDGYHHYLGIYYPYAWPFSKGPRETMVREAVSFLGSVCAAFASQSESATPYRGAPGPWARPDPRSEKAAIRHVGKYLRNAGYSVRSKEAVCCGYDLLATRGSEELHVEVKGCVGVLPRFFVSRNEINTAKADASWRLAVVTNASKRPTAPRLLTHQEMQRAFDLQATSWEGRPRNRLV